MYHCCEVEPKLFEIYIIVWSSFQLSSFVVKKNLLQILKVLEYKCSIWNSLVPWHIVITYCNWVLCIIFGTTRSIIRLQYTFPLMCYMQHLHKNWHIKTVLWMCTWPKHLAIQHILAYAEHPEYGRLPFLHKRLHFLSYSVQLWFCVL
jgi:hypothetical protein